MQQEDGRRVARTFVDVGDAQPVDLDLVEVEREVGKIPEPLLGRAQNLHPMEDRTHGGASFLRAF